MICSNNRFVNLQFIWRPYRDFLQSMPQYYFAGQAIWMTISPLICMHIVEWHLPHRVFRQFGRVQVIPDRVDTSIALHAMDGRGRYDTLWADEHALFVAMWGERAARVIVADVTDQPIVYHDPYMQWFRKMTLLLVENPAHRHPSGYQPHGPILLSLVWFNCLVMLLLSLKFIIVSL